MPATGLLKICEWNETYDRVTISPQAKLLAISMVAFRDNKQALYGIFSMFLQLPIHRKTASLNMQNYCMRWKQPKKQKLTLIFTTHAHFFKLKYNLLTGKLPYITAFFTIILQSLKAFLSLLLLLHSTWSSIQSNLSVFFVEGNHFLLPVQWHL